MFTTNTKAPFFMREATKHLAGEGKGINVGTTLQGLMVRHYSAYAGCKTAPDMFTRPGQGDWCSRHHGQLVCPGPLDTAFFHAQETPQTTAFLSSLTPLSRLGNVDDIVPVIEFLIAYFLLGQRAKPSLSTAVSLLDKYISLVGLIPDEHMHFPLSYLHLLAMLQFSTIQSAILTARLMWLY